MSICIVLVGTTHPGNIGACARAMKNMGIHDMRLVNPQKFPHAEAKARASGAEDVLENAAIFERLEDAITDCVYVAGASARSRSIDWPLLDAKDAAAKIAVECDRGMVAVVFGPEQSGLCNSDLDRCNTLLTIPTDPNFSSLNLGMAVQVVTYEIRSALITDKMPEYVSDEPAATSDDMEHFYVHLEQVLTASLFLDPENPRNLMRRLRRLFSRVRPDRNELNILRGILSSVGPKDSGK
jgi:tRNA (cytidine32/uridine32-2'-O)-methyltransferase